MSKPGQAIRFFLVLLAGALGTAAFSLAGFGSDELLAEAGGFRITVAAAGIGLALIVTAAFTGYRMSGVRKRAGRKMTFGDLADSVGFGLLPGIATWKAFEQFTAAGSGVAAREPLDRLWGATEEGLFLPCRIELCAALISFAGIVLWLVIRKRELSGNGDLALSVLCVYGAIRAVTENLRAQPWIRLGVFSLVIPLCCALNWNGLILWSVRRDKVQKNSFLNIVEFAGALFCTCAILLISAGVLSAGNWFVDLLIVTIAALILAVISLSAGMDARKLKNAVYGATGGAG